MKYRTNWTKAQAIKQFGSVTAMAKALNTSTQAISILPGGPLKQKKSDEIVGHLVRTGVYKLQEGES